MFTGIIAEVGEITAFWRRDDSARVTVRAPGATAGAKTGHSIAVSGVCLTVVSRKGDTFQADVMAETLAVSTFGAALGAALGTATGSADHPAAHSITAVQAEAADQGEARAAADTTSGEEAHPAAVLTARPPSGRGLPVNIESALRVGDPLGGHIVQGHVDGTATLLTRADGVRWRVLRFSLAPRLAPLVAYKGSVALDGVSLTVSGVGDDWFEVSLIPETIAATTLGALAEGDSVNLETDILARHIRRLSAFGRLAGDDEPWGAPAAGTEASRGGGGAHVREHAGDEPAGNEENR
ncbi:MAG TPA: riboflavin synthase [Microbacteriaceae bacterium]|nr:riboflavin synthase [Microbacteriaceae bacterium]